MFNKRLKLNIADKAFIRDYGEELHFIYFCVEIIRDELSEEEEDILIDRLDVVYDILKRDKKYEHRKVDNIVITLFSYFIDHKKTHDEVKAEGVDIEEFEKWLRTSNEVVLL